MQEPKPFSAEFGAETNAGQMAYWLDHKGAMLGPGPVDNPTGFGKYGRLTHRIMKPQAGQLAAGRVETWQEYERWLACD